MEYTQEILELKLKIAKLETALVEMQLKHEAVKNYLDTLRANALEQLGRMSSGLQDYLSRMTENLYSVSSIGGVDEADGAATDMPDIERPGNEKDSNSGYRNAGSYNSGDWNAGTANSGDHNVGSYNTGDWNIGNFNSGDWNKTSLAAGCFNTGVKKLEFFDKETNITLYDWRTSEAFNVMQKIASSPTSWIYRHDMTDAEKSENPHAKITGGYLKVNIGPRGSQQLWDELSDSEKEIVRKIPNFDAEKFKEITGIDSDI